MRQDKLTTKFQQALGEAQSLAVAHDNQYIEPEHVLLAVLNDEEGGAIELIERAGGNPAQLLQKPVRRWRSSRVSRAPLVMFKLVETWFVHSISLRRRPWARVMDLSRPRCFCWH